MEVPGPLAVIGVDDLPSAALSVPPLTTVTVDTRVLADYLARSVAADLVGRPRPGGLAPYHHRIVVRESV